MTRSVFDLITCQGGPWVPMSVFTNDLTNYAGFFLFRSRNLKFKITKCELILNINGFTGQKGCFLAQKRGKTSNIANVPYFNQLNLDQSTNCLPCF